MLLHAHTLKKTFGSTVIGQIVLCVVICLFLVGKHRPFFVLLLFLVRLPFLALPDAMTLFSAVPTLSAELLLVPSCFALGTLMTLVPVLATVSAQTFELLPDCHKSKFFFPCLVILHNPFIPAT